MNRPAILHMVPLLALLVWAAVTDLRERKIRNWLTLSLMLSGLAQSLFPLHCSTPWGSVLGLLTGFGITFLLFAIGAIGGGDVKLMAGVGAWIGPAGVISVFVIYALMSMVFVLVQAIYQGRLLRLLHNSALITINLVHLREVGVEHVIATGQSAKSVDCWRLPVAVPVLIALAFLAIRSYVFHSG